MLLTMGLCLTVLGQDVLPGSNLSLQQVKAEARFIVVAEVVKTGDILGLGAVSIMTGVELNPSAVVKGKVSREELRNLSVSASGNERLPKEGEGYLFYIDEIKQSGNFNIIKVLPKTEENVKESMTP